VQVVGDLARELLPHFLLDPMNNVGEPFGDCLARHAGARRRVFVG
jgi:hypothetical protein